MSVYDVYIMSNAITTAHFMQYVIKKGDFCGAILPPAYIPSRDFSQAEVLVERLATKISLLLNRKNFVGAGSPIVTWSGPFKDFVAAMNTSQWKVGYQALLFFITRSRDKKEFLLLKQGLEAIHYTGTPEVMGERAYFIKEVEKDVRSKTRPEPPGEMRQLKLL